MEYSKSYGNGNSTGKSLEILKPLTQEIDTKGHNKLTQTVDISADIQAIQYRDLTSISIGCLIHSTPSFVGASPPMFLGVFKIAKYIQIFGKFKQASSHIRD